ncbi:hypothetical protein MMC14_001450 [Varicellaria rhodocarpa]|nr:hypothetical protein [Varicellaria rhodocarpa]
MPGASGGLPPPSAYHKPWSHFQPVIPPSKPSLIDKKPQWLQEISSSWRNVCLDILNQERAQLLDEYACKNCVRLGVQCVVVPGFDFCARCTGSGRNSQCNLDVPSVLASIAGKALEAQSSSAKAPPQTVQSSQGRGSIQQSTPVAQSTVVPWSERLTRSKTHEMAALFRGKTAGRISTNKEGWTFESSSSSAKVPRKMVPTRGVKRMMPKRGGRRGASSTRSISTSEESWTSQPSIELDTPLQSMASTKAVTRGVSGVGSSTGRSCAGSARSARSQKIRRPTNRSSQRRSSMTPSTASYIPSRSSTPQSLQSTQIQSAPPLGPELKSSNLGEVVRSEQSTLPQMLTSGSLPPFDPALSTGIQALKELPQIKWELHQSQGELHQVREKASHVMGELYQTRGELRQTSGELHQTRGELRQTRGELHQTRGELRQTKGELHQVRGELHQVRGGSHQVRKELHRVREELECSRRGRMQTLEPMFGSFNSIEERGAATKR